MKPFIFASTLLILGLAGAPLFTVAAQPMSMTVAFAPNPPRQGTETIVIQLSNASHRPVNDAKVTIATSMPSMSMTGPSVQATHKGPGRYVASMKLSFATRWAFSVSAQANGSTAKRTVLADIR